MIQAAEKAIAALLVIDDQGRVESGNFSRDLSAMASRPVNVVIWLKEPLPDMREVVESKTKCFSFSSIIEAWKAQQLEADLATIRATLKHTSEENAELKAEAIQHSDFMAFITSELAEFPCCHEAGAHSGTPPMMWPELVGCIAKKARLDAEADAKASEMMLKQVCEERDGYAKIWELAGERGFDAVKEVEKLRELLRDCPLLGIGNVDVATSLNRREVWIDRAREEALKL